LQLFLHILLVFDKFVDTINEHYLRL
jgi:hypothetical protein